MSLEIIFGRTEAYFVGELGLSSFAKAILHKLKEFLCLRTPFGKRGVDL
jgi:hypothetical protein